MKTGSMSRLLGVVVGSFAIASAYEARAQEHGWSSIAPILDKHCSRCHEDGKTKGKFKERPAGKFGFVLDEDEMIKHNKLKPGNAEGSEIFAVILKGDMPKDIEDACSDGSAGPTTYCGLSKEETAALHDEINKLAEPTRTLQIVAADAVLAKPDPTPPVTKVEADTKAPAPTVAPVAEVPTTGAPVVAVPVTAPPVATYPTPTPTAPVAEYHAPTPTAPVADYHAPTPTAPVADYHAPTPTAPVADYHTPTPVAPVAVAAPQPFTFITERQIIRAISEDVSSAPPGDGASYRYLTLTHLLNAGESEKDLRAYRLALTKIVNSLSSETDVYVPVPIDAGKTIFRLDIRKLGWTPSTWDTIVATDPYVVFYADTQFKGLQRDLHTIAPFVRGDWFTFATARPPLYNKILGLPKTRAELQAKLGLNVKRDFDERHVERAGFQQSGVSSNNRLIERHSISTGAYWESYDFGSNEDRKSLFQFPVGPPGAFQTASDRFGFEQDGGEIIFALPNGFHAYYLTDGKGNQLDIGPTKIVRDPSQRDFSVTNGITCMGCHDKGMKTNDFRPGKPLDQLRDVVMRSGTFPSEVKDIVKEIFPTGDDFKKRLDSDAKRYATALENAGISVNTRLDGIEIVNALSKHFEENLNARLAAAEVGMTEDTFMERLNAAGKQAYDLKLRLQQDLVPRDQFVALFAQLVNTINDDGDKAVDLSKVAKQSGTTVAAITQEGYRPPQTSKTFDLAFYANDTKFKVGDLITFTLRSEQPCFLTVTDTDDHGAVVTLFPNAHHQDSRIEANQSIQIPGPTVTGFVIRAKDPTTEHVVASCNASFQELGQKDFQGQDFKTFDNTRALLERGVEARKEYANRVLVIEAAGAPAPLVANPIEPKVAIVATKALTLIIRAH